MCKVEKPVQRLASPGCTTLIAHHSAAPQYGHLDAGVISCGGNWSPDDGDKKSRLARDLAPWGVDVRALVASVGGPG